MFYMKNGLSAVELLSVNHPNSSDRFVLLLCKDSGCLGICGYLFKKALVLLGDQSPSR